MFNLLLKCIGQGSNFPENSYSVDTEGTKIIFLILNGSLGLT